jgi:hypothetical protein
MHDSDMPILRAFLAEHDPYGGRFADEGRRGRRLISTSSFPDLGSRRKQACLCAAPKQIVAGHRIAAAWGKHEVLAAYVRHVSPGWQADSITMTTSIAKKTSCAIPRRFSSLHGHHAFGQQR